MAIGKRRLTLASLLKLVREDRKNEVGKLKRDFWGFRITTVYCFLQGNGSILRNASCVVDGVRDFLIF